MSLSNIAIKVIGLILAFVGLALILSVVGVGLGMGIGLSPWWLSVVLGVVFLAAGIYLIRGGSISL